MLKQIFSVVWPIFLVIIFFCGSIVVHEFGHYLAAKVRGLYIPRFSIGFGPALWKKKIGETEFRLSLLPLGGYVSLPQLADLKEIEGEFRLPEGLKSATCADKVIVAIMGPIANLLFAIFLSCVLWHSGLPVDGSSLSRTVGYVERTLTLDGGEIVISPARLGGLEVGDEIVSIDGFAVNNFGDIQHLIALGANRDTFGRAKLSMKIIRGDRHLDLDLRPVLISKNGSDKLRAVGILPKQELVVEKLSNEQRNIKIGDQILKVNDVDVWHSISLREIVSNCRSVKLEVLRNGAVVICWEDTVPMAVEKPYVVLNFEDIAADVIPFYPENVDKSSIEESSDGKLLLLSERGEDLQKYNLYNGLEVVRINGFDCHNLCDVAHRINRYGANTLTVLKSDMAVDVIIPKAQVRLVPAVYTNVLGVELKNATVTLHKPPSEQIKDALTKTCQAFGSLLNRNSDIFVKHLSGPTELIRTLYSFSKADIRLLLWFVIVININLAILNMLPLPVLDGGCVVVSIIEGATGKKYVTKIFGILQSIFLFILFGLLIYVSFFDVKRWVADNKLEDEYSRQARLRM
ncbi:MAG: site-2 protease family protein [Puniceicoccales bacterium]|nr:site-2 protease family protein [Puniceicoccales bacterium]